MPDRPTKITFGEMRDMGVRGKSTAPTIAAVTAEVSGRLYVPPVKKTERAPVREPEPW